MCDLIHGERDDVDDCPFCGDDEVVEERNCRDDQNVISDGEKLVCTSCGIVHGYESVKARIDFYGSMYLFRRTSVYHRKYHLVNRLLKVLPNEFQIGYDRLNKIIRIFVLLGMVRTNRCIMPNFNFIFKKLFEMMKMPCNFLKLTTGICTSKKYGISKHT